MNKQQYTITEHNEHEGEYFSYILELDEAELQKINKIIEKINNEDEILELEKTNLTQYEVDLINKYSNNSYMERIGFYELNDGILDKKHKHGTIFYKGVGLTKQ